MPIPSPKGFFSDLEGMVSASVCLPGYYSPTIEVGATRGWIATGLGDVHSVKTSRSYLSISKSEKFLF